ncbi:AAA family ATPase [Providencia rettgeri]|uniref:AAA family ATPase n=1 Tax=Providencia rettgeri TaxID=587 RepID=UPI0023618F5D|nr:AAA family ATPase [Providencia rettgeri]
MSETNNINFFPVEYFKILGLYGYKNLSMVMKGKTTIFAAENGAGKTTILNALKAVLLSDMPSLRKLNFKKIIIKFKEDHEEISILNEDIKNENLDDFKLLLENELRLEEDIWDDINVDDALFAIDRCNDSFSIDDDFVMQRIYMSSTYHMDSFMDKLLPLQAKIKAKGSLFSDTGLEIPFNKIKNNMAKYNVIFLPTYRRVEKKLDNVKSKNKYAPRFTRKSSDNKKNNHDKIYYGLSDVEETLSQITLDIERESNIGYRALTAKMLDDLVKGEYDNESNLKSDLPSITDLKRFLNRVKPENNAFNIEMGNFLITELEGLYSRNEVQQNKYLHYFLSKLNLVIEETKEQESKIEEFVGICNKYLSSAGDSKRLRFDPFKLEVVVNDEHSDERISLNDLSSGEKQVISIMSILFLSNDKKNKIILIDEPELSLSLKWQRLLLPDIDSGTNVSQVIAITHSPFIYDNSLEKSATSMKVTKDIVKKEA